MRALLHRIYSTYSLSIFGLVFLLLLPFFVLLIIFPPLRRYLRYLHWLWSALFLGLSGVPWEIEYRYRPRRGEQFVICANHFSILDIVSLGLLPVNFIFIGKSSLSRIPLFGFMFRRLHITVDRSSRKDSYRALQEALKAIDKGQSLVMFPEGGVLSAAPPRMARFKEGPFRVAVEKQIPLLPITIPYNWLILPDDNRYLLYPQKMKLVVHPPLLPEGKELEEVGRLREQLYQLIDQELKNYSLYEDRQGNFTEDRSPGAAGV